LETYHYKIRGIVQGVAFRYYTKKEADLLKISGTVKNLPDGSVEIYAAGTPVNLRYFEDFLKLGPGSAQVSNVEKTPAEKGKIFSTFEILC